MGMTTEEYKAQSGRFRVLSFDDAAELGAHVDAPDEFGFCLLDFSTSPPTFIGDDRCPPEDASLCRDFYWVCYAMNKLAEDAYSQALCDVNNEGY